MSIRQVTLKTNQEEEFKNRRKKEQKLHTNILRRAGEMKMMSFKHLLMMNGFEIIESHTPNCRIFIQEGYPIKGPVLWRSSSSGRVAPHSLKL